jgi:thiol-disulfide isomerase/thioredoxin
MRIFKPILILSIVSLVMVYSTPQLNVVRAQEPTVTAGVNTSNNVTLYLFWGNGCPHCESEIKFLNKIQKDYPTLTIKKFEVWGSSKNREIFAQVGQKLGADVKGVPFTVIGNNSIGGYYNDDTTGAEIRDEIDKCVQNGCPDVVSEFTPTPPTVSPETSTDNPWKNAPKSLPKQVNVPLVGSVDLTTLSLPVITIVIGLLDGFNPCAMWILLFLISLLLNLENKKRRWIIGSTFILSSGLVYFFFMAAWLNILLFIGLIVWVRVAIALFALGAGAFSLKKFWQHHTGCIVENDEKRKKTFEKLKKITYDKNLLVALFGIIALAFAVNLVELLCSAGFPAIFTQILALHQLPPFQSYFYIFLYIFFFMLDDIIVFVVAMKTLETTGISTKYSKYSHLIGGILMLAIGALMIIKPQYLMLNF